MAILSKACKPDNFELYNSLKLSFANIQGLCSNFVDCESFLESNSPDIFTQCETNLDDTIDSVDFSVRGYLPLKGLWSGDGQIFQVWPYLNSLIIIKLPFSQQEHVQIFPLPSPSKTCALPFDFALERDPKNIFYYQRDVENCTDQVLNFLLFDEFSGL